MGLAGCASPEKQGLALGSLVTSSVADGLGACPVQWKLVKNMDARGGLSGYKSQSTSY